MIGALMLLLGLGGISMSGQTIEGAVLDPRIGRCGVIVTGEDIATFRPFIEVASALSGTIRLTIEASSLGGTSRTAQSWHFAGDLPAEASVTIGRPRQVTLALEATDSAGTALCRLRHQFDFRDGARSA